MNINTSILSLALATALAPAGLAQSPFSVGNLVLVRVGDGTAALSANTVPVFLDEYTPAGTLVQTMALPTAASGSNRAITVRGNATSEAYLNVSTNGIYLLMAGYDAPVGTASVGSVTAATINRVIARVDLGGNIDTTTVLTDAYDGSATIAGNPRAVASDDGLRFWMSGTGAGSSGGVRFVTNVGATTSLLLNAGAPSNCRVAGIYDSQLFTTSASTVYLGVCTVGTGLPTTGSQPITLLPGFPAGGGTTAGSAYDFFWADPNTVYVADDNAPNSTISGISKWTLTGGLWTRAYRFTLNLPNNQFAGARGLTGFVRNGVATLWATANTTTSGADATQLITVTDTGASSVVTSLATSGVNTAFRGLRYVAKPSTINRIPASCGTTPADIKVSGNGEIGTDVRTTVLNATVFPLVIYGLTQIGLPVFPGCSCVLGQTGDLLVTGAVSTLSIPNNPALSGATIYTQGMDFFGAGGCVNPTIFTLTDYFSITVQ